MNFSELNPSQQKAVKTIDGPLLVLAGAGSGKTRVITYRIANMIECGIPEKNIVAITFTNKAAREMKERMCTLLGREHISVIMCTIHSLCVKILRQCYSEAGYQRGFQICDEEDAKTRIKNILTAKNLDKKMASDVLDVISKLKDGLITPALFYERGLDEMFSIPLGDIYETYQKGLKQDNTMDFDDLIMETVFLFENHPEVLDMFQERFRYISVDEYQDTNHSQYTLIQLLAGKYRNLCVVGDDYQSIYRFRGADISNILSFQRDYPDAKVVTLGENYRSTQTIVDAASGLISNNEEQMQKDLFSVNEEGDPIRVVNMANTFTESAYIVREIERAIKKGVALYDIAVLYRKNAQSRQIEDKLISAHIPYVIHGGIGFYQRAEVKDLIAYLKLAAGSNDTSSVIRIINKPKRGVGKAYLDKALQECDDQDICLWDYLCKETKKAGVVSFVELIQSLREIAKQDDLVFLLQRILEDTDLAKYVLEEYAKKDDDANKTKERLENLSEVVNKAADYLDHQFAELSEEEKKLGRINSFVDDIALLTDADRMSEADGVQLMTVHGSKGLEFHTVFMYGMQEGIFPDGRDAEETNEERRLCYVGMTRAKKRLYMTYSDNVYMYGQTQPGFPSRFLGEVPFHLMKRIDYKYYS